MENFIQLHNFIDVTYYDDTHTYVYKNEMFTSVTTFIKKFEVPFEKDYWAKYKILQSYGLKVQNHTRPDVPYGFIKVAGELYHHEELNIDSQHKLREWEGLADLGKSKGTKQHSILEYASMNKYPTKGTFVEEYNRRNRHLVPVKLEYVVADFENKIAGQLDALFFNTLTGELEIHDYKTDKELKFTNKYQSFKAPIDFLSQCNFNKYTLQLNLYKHCIEKYTNLKIGKMYIIHITDTLTPYEITSSPDIVKLMLR